MTETRVLALVDNWYLYVHEERVWIEHKCGSCMPCAMHQTLLLLCPGCLNEAPTEIEAMFRVAKMCLPNLDFPGRRP